MSMLQLHLVRHGQTNFNAQRKIQGQYDSVLDETGHQQAEQLRPDIESLHITAVYSSSNLRARQTTFTIAHAAFCRSMRSAAAVLTVAGVELASTAWNET